MKNMYRRFRIALMIGASAFFATLCGTAHAAAMTAGVFTSAQSCQIYAVSWGRELAWSDPLTAGYARQWGTDLYKDCFNQFSRLRQSVAAVLASASQVAGHDPTAGRGYVLSGRVLQVSHENSSYQSNGVAMAGEKIFMSIEFLVKDRAGRTVYGGSIQKKVPLSSATATRSIRSSVEETGGGVYEQVQRDIALAVVRAALFKIEPLRVTANNGRRIKLNYGSALVPMGSTISVEGEGGMSTILMNVVGGTSDGVLAESEVGGDISSIQIGGVARFLEADDPEASAPRYEQVRLRDN